MIITYYHFSKIYSIETPDHFPLEPHLLIIKIILIIDALVFPVIQHHYKHAFNSIYKIMFVYILNFPPVKIMVNLAIKGIFAQADILYFVSIVEVNLQRRENNNDNRVHRVCLSCNLKLE